MEDKKIKKSFTIIKKDGAPDYVIGSFGCKFDELEPFINSKGYVNFDILKSREGDGMYVKINEYGLDKAEKTNTEVTKIETITDEEIPF